MAKLDGAEVTEPEREQRRQAGTRHGASSYLARLADGRLITAAMGLCESEVLRLYATGGERAMIEAAAVKFETAARMIWQHLDQAAAQDVGPMLASWQRLQRDAVSTWATLRTLPPQAEGDLTGEVIESLKDANR